MRDPIRCILSLLLAAVMLFSFAGCAPKEEDTGAGRPFSTVLPGDPECLDPQFTENENAVFVIRNTMEGLLRPDVNGNPVPAGASGYTVSEDGKSYLFTLIGSELIKLLVWSNRLWLPCKDNTWNPPASHRYPARLPW